MPVGGKAGYSVRHFLNSLLISVECTCIIGKVGVLALYNHLVPLAGQVLDMFHPVLAVYRVTAVTLPTPAWGLLQ